MEKFSPIKRLLKLLNADKKDISQIYIYSIFIGLLNLSLPLGIQAIINFIQTGEVSTSWILLVFLVVSGIVLAGVLQIMQMRITENLQQKIFIRSSFEFAFRIPRFELNAIRRLYTPELANRFFDTMTIQKGLPKLLIDFSTAALQLLFGLILLSVYHPFFIVFSSVLLVVVCVMLYFTGKKGLETSLQESKYKYKVAYWLEELSRTMNTFKLVGTSSIPLDNTNKLVESYIQERENHFKVIYGQFLQLVGFKSLIALILLLIGGFLVINQQINIGQFIAAEIIILLVINSIEKIILNLENLYDVLTAIDKIGFVTDLPIEDEGGKLVSQASEKPMEVNIQKMSFRYSDINNYVFKDFDLTIKSGQHTAIVGDTGEGKTTLLNLIGNLYPLESGSISFNNIPAYDLNLQYLRSMIGGFTSEQKLFMGTIEENITMKRDNITLEQLIAVCQQVGLLEYIQSSKNGFSTYIDPNGKGFLASISLKIILARCIISKPKLLLMDDHQEFTYKSFKNLDQMTNQLFSEDAPWTIIASIKNENLLHHFKQVIHIENGEIIFQGTPEAYNEYKKGN